MNGGERERERERGCAACRADSIASDCGDDTIATAIRVFAPPHTCGAEANLEQEAERERAERSALKSMDLVAFNASCEARFVEYLASLLVDGPMTVVDVLRECAYDLDVSVETVKRYLLKHSARRARFEVRDGRVALRSGNERDM